MIALYAPCRLKLRSDVILRTLGGDPNSATTLPYIPGSALRGIIAKRLKEDAVDQEAFRTLILDGTVRYLNAYPVVDKRRSLPSPLSFRVEKFPADVPPPVYDLAAFEGHPDDPASWPRMQLVPVPGPFLTLGAAEPRQATPVLGSRVHHQRDRAKGRAWKDENGQTHGAIFTYEFIEAGQEFEALIQTCTNNRSEGETLLGNIRDLISSSATLLGRSRKAEYGGDPQVTMDENAIRDSEPVKSFIKDDIKDGETFRMILLSDCLTRNQLTGQLDPMASEGELMLALGNRAHVMRRRWSFRIVGGYNRTWRLELPQVNAVAAGSIFVLRATTTIPSSVLRDCEHRGLGERRVEGYGRIAFLDYPVPAISLYGHWSRDRALRPADDEPPDEVSRIEAAVALQRATQAIREAAAGIGKNVKGPLPTRSLIGRLRVPMRAEPDDALGTLRTWLGDGDPTQWLKEPARAKLERCRMGTSGESLYDWLKIFAGEGRSQRLGEELGFGAIAASHHIFSSETALAHLTASEETLAVQLIDAVLAILAQRSRSD